MNNPASTAQRPYQSINFAQKLGLFSEQWTPKVIAEMNDYQFKISRLQGEFVWHAHAETDETFIVLDGLLHIDFRDGRVSIASGEMFVVPRGGAQALVRRGGQAAADRTPWRAQYRRPGRRTHGTERYLDLIPARRSAKGISSELPGSDLR